MSLPLCCQFERTPLVAADILAARLAGKTVIDLGCGDGWLASYLLAAGVLITGCELDPVLHAEAVRRGVVVTLASFDDATARATPTTILYRYGCRTCMQSLADLNIRQAIWTMDYPIPGRLAAERIEVTETFWRKSRQMNWTRKRALYRYDRVR